MAALHQLIAMEEPGDVLSPSGASGFLACWLQVVRPAHSQAAGSTHRRAHYGIGGACRHQRQLRTEDRNPARPTPGRRQGRLRRSLGTVDQGRVSAPLRRWQAIACPPSSATTKNPPS